MSGKVLPPKGWSMAVVVNLESSRSAPDEVLEGDFSDDDFELFAALLLRLLATRGKAPPDRCSCEAKRA